MQIGLAFLVAVVITLIITVGGHLMDYSGHDHPLEDHGHGGLKMGDEACIEGAASLNYGPPETFILCGKLIPGNENNGPSSPL